MTYDRHMTSRWRTLVVASALVACGDNSRTPVPEVEAECHEVAWLGEEPLEHVELGPAVPDTLEDFDPSGRWFLTGLALGNVRLERRSDGAIQILDGGVLLPGRTELLANWVVELAPSLKFRVAVRISNRRDDGSLRYQRVLCTDDTCNVCTAGMIRAERHDKKPSEKLSLVGSLALDGRSLDVKVLGTTAYVIGGGGLTAIDTTDPTRPVLLDHHPSMNPESRSNDVAMFETGGRQYALVADAPCEIIDVTNPSDLRLVALIPVEAHTVFTETRDGTTRAYFGGLDGTTPVYDITDALVPRRLGAFDADASYVHDLFVQDGIGYLNAWEKGFFVVDFTDPQNAVQLGHWPSPHEQSHASWVTTVGGRRIAVHGEELYDAYMTVLDVDPASPQFMKPLSTYQTREYVSIHNFTGVGTKTYFTHYQDGVRVIDLADPTKPKLVGYYNTWDPDDLTAADGFFTSAIGLDLDVARKLIFVADTDRGLLILRDGT
jgi:hypothetical protein